MGISSFLGAGVGAVGAGLSSWILSALPFPTSFATVFAIAAAGMCLSWAFLALVREPVRDVAQTRQSHADFLGGLREILARDHNFRLFLGGRVLLATSAMGLGFLAVGAVQRWQLADAEIGLFTAALLVGQAGGNLIFGLVADRIGHLSPLRVGAACSALAYGLALAAPGPQWYLLVFGAMGLSIGAANVSGLLVVMEFAPADRRPTYVGLTNSLIGLAAGVSPIVGALVAGTNYWALYAVSFAAAIGALAVFVLRVQEPRYARQPAGDQ
jgi:AAHS family 4-hydroxybenzoate transporter-like MFS transporter